MCSDISFLLGLVLLIKGRFRVSNREVPKRIGRIVGLVLMSPPLITAIYVFLVVGPRGIFDEAVLVNIAFVQIASLLLALSVAGYLVFSLPQTASSTFPQSPATPRYNAVMTPAEVADYLRISEFEVIALIEEGKLPAARIGGEYRIARSAVDDFLTSRGAE